MAVIPPDTNQNPANVQPNQQGQAGIPGSPEDAKFVHSAADLPNQSKDPANRDPAQVRADESAPPAQPNQAGPGQPLPHRGEDASPAIQKPSPSVAPGKNR